MTKHKEEKLSFCFHSKVDPAVHTTTAETGKLVDHVGDVGKNVITVCAF